MIQILVLHGPNLNMLGKREKDLYGEQGLEMLNQDLIEYGQKIGIQVTTAQSNLEGELINSLQEADDRYEGVVFNPGGYTHTSVAIRDAVKAISIPVVEAHLTNIQGREDFRQVSMIAPVCSGSISGFGRTSYLLGIDALRHELQKIK